MELLSNENKVFLFLNKGALCQLITSAVLQLHLLAKLPYFAHLTDCCLVQLFATPWTVARQAPLSMEFSRQEYWSGLPFLLQGIFPTQGLNPTLLHWQVDSLPLSHLGSTPFDGYFTENSDLAMETMEKPFYCSISWKHSNQRLFSM